MKIIFVLILALAAWVVVAQPRAGGSGSVPREVWFHAEITLRPAANGQKAWILPFDVVSVSSSDKARPAFFVVNGLERLPLSYTGSTPEGYERYEIPYFQGELIWRKEGRQLAGFWMRPDRGTQYELVLSPGKLARFALNEAPVKQFLLEERYALVQYEPGSPAEKGRRAIAALTEHSDGTVTGSIMTESGDYRYLAGNRSGNRIHLSTFNGIFAYVFELELTENGEILGRQLLNGSSELALSGRVDLTAKLADPTGITGMKPGVKRLVFSLPHYKTGELLGPDLGRPAVIQIMGSWCPNCLDESVAFKQFQAAFPEVQFFGIAFERSAEREEAFAAVDKFVRGLDLRYPVLFAGRAASGAVEKVLEGLVGFQSYPTTIYLDRQGEVRKIYSGFYGPGTPEYEPWLQETLAFIEKLQSE